MMRYVGETIEQYRARTGRAAFETEREQRARMQEECRQYARDHNPPHVVASLERAWKGAQS